MAPSPESIAAFDAASTSRRSARSEEYEDYPAEWVSPPIERRRRIGWDMDGLLGVAKAKGDRARLHAQLGRNRLFSDAPLAEFAGFLE